MIGVGDQPTAGFVQVIGRSILTRRVVAHESLESRQNLGSASGPVNLREELFYVVVGVDIVDFQYEDLY